MANGARNVLLVKEWFDRSSRLRKERAADRLLQADFAGALPPAVSRAAPFLHPGAWNLVHGDTGRPGERVPVALVREGVDVPEDLDGRAFSRQGTAKKLDFVWTPVEVPHVPPLAGDFRADVWLLRKDNKWLLFDLERSEVLRWPEHNYTEEYVRLRRAFERHVPSVRFRVEEQGAWLREPIVGGVELRDLAPTGRTAVRRQLLRGLAELVEHAQQTAPVVADEQPLEVALGRSPIEEARRRNREAVGLLGFRSSTHVPVHGDLQRSNVRVDSGGAVTVIDFGELRLGPFYSDPIFIAQQDLDVWASGGFDAELAAVWEAAGLSPVRWDRDKVRLMLLADTVVRSDRELFAARGLLAPVRRATRAERVRRAWNAQVSALP